MSIVVLKTSKIIFLKQKTHVPTISLFAMELLEETPMLALTTQAKEKR